MRPFSLRVEIEGGDAAVAHRPDAAGQAAPFADRATLALFARTTAGDVPLVRWPTTIGGWQRQNVGQGQEVLRYKPSPTGHFVWRELIAAPAWFPPPSTPDRELVRQRPDGRWTANHRAVGPGYASAYGLVALLHHRAATPAGGPPWVDVNVRTHGSGSYRSILRRSSHGCHRLFNHLAIRLGSFLVGHGGAVRLGQSTDGYEHAVRWRGSVYRLRAASRGYRFELSPPIDVHVLPDRADRSRRSSPPGAELPELDSHALMQPMLMQSGQCGREGVDLPPRTAESGSTQTAESGSATSEARSLLLSPSMLPAE
jgi:hypothetical protein